MRRQASERWPLPLQGSRKRDMAGEMETPKTSFAGLISPLLSLSHTIPGEGGFHKQGIQKWRLLTYTTQPHEAVLLAYLFLYLDWSFPTFPKSFTLSLMLLTSLPQFLSMKTKSILSFKNYSETLLHIKYMKQFWFYHLVVWKTSGSFLITIISKIHITCWLIYQALC